MQPPKPLKSAHENLKESLHEWFRVIERFDDKNDWPEGNFSPQGRKIQKAADRIVASVMMLRRPPEVETDEDFIELLDSCPQIEHYALVMDLAVQHGTNAILDYGEIGTRKTRDLFVAWQNVCAEVDSFARSAARELKGLQSKYRDASDSDLLYDAFLGLENTAKEAMSCSKMLNRRNRDD
jgi:hypothetical protein